MSEEIKAGLGADHCWSMEELAAHYLTATNKIAALESELAEWKESYRKQNLQLMAALSEKKAWEFEANRIDGLLFDMNKVRLKLESELAGWKEECEKLHLKDAELHFEEEEELESAISKAQAESAMLWETLREYQYSFLIGNKLCCPDCGEEKNVEEKHGSLCPIGKALNSTTAGQELLEKMAALEAESVELKAENVAMKLLCTKESDLFEKMAAYRQALESINNWYLTLAVAPVHQTLVVQVVEKMAAEAKKALSTPARDGEGKS